MFKYFQGMDYCALQQMDDEIDIVMNELDGNEGLSPRDTPSQVCCHNTHFS